MRKRLLLSLFVLFSVTPILSAQETEKQIEDAYPGYDLIFHDEFEGRKGAKFNSKNWVFNQDINSNYVAQAFTTSQKNAHLDGDGHLVIAAYKENPQITGSNGKKYWYSSAKLYCKFKQDESQSVPGFKYGRVVVRAKIPCAEGNWPAIWMLGQSPSDVSWPYTGEVDIMEHYLIDGKHSILANVCNGNSKSASTEDGQSWQTRYKTVDELAKNDPNWRDEYHVWRCDWDRDYIKLYLDDVLMNSFAVANANQNMTWIGKKCNPFRDWPFVLILGMNLGAQAGSLDFFESPQSFYIDYVRIYSKENSNTTQTLPTDGSDVELKQGTAYKISKASGQYINPSWFTANSDGTYTFQGIDGTYTLYDHSSKGSLSYIEVRNASTNSTLQSDGSGALYLVGTQVGLPSAIENPQSFDISNLDNMIGMTPVKKGVYEITLTSGVQIDGSDICLYADKTHDNKTHRLSPSGADGYKVTSISGPIGMDKYGNLTATQNIPYRSTIVLTVDCSKGVSNIALSSTYIAPSTNISPAFNGKTMTNKGFDYYYTGSFTQGQSYTVSGADDFKDADWYYDIDYFEKNANGTLKFLPVSGTYTVRANFATRSFQIYPSEADGTPASYNVDNGTGAVYIRGHKWITKPSYNFAINFMDGVGTLDNNLPMAPVGKNKWQLTLRYGKEISPDANNYYNTNRYYFRMYGTVGKTAGMVFGNVVNQWFKAAYTIPDKTYIKSSTKTPQNIITLKKFEEGKTYRLILDTSEPKNAKLSVEVFDTPTSIRSITTSIGVNDHAVYNLAGQRVDRNYKGVVIIGGKKRVNR